MIPVTVDLPEDLQRELERIARLEGRSEEDLILEGIRQVVERYSAPKPRIPLFSSDDASLAERVDDEMKGFGEEP